METDLIDESLFDPYQMTPEQFTTIRQIARFVMKKEKCDYTKAIVIAYIEWLSMAEMDTTKH